MLGRGWGRIVFLVSATALLGRRGQVNYAAAKAGLIGLGRGLAREVGALGITVNCVSAGLVDTTLTADVPPISARSCSVPFPSGGPGVPRRSPPPSPFSAPSARATSPAR